MVEMTPARWRDTNRYIAEVFGSEDESLARITKEAIAAGLPDIAIDASVGRLLMILTAMTQGRLAVDVGTLAGYSAAWIARGLHSGGRLVTIEIEASHAAFAQRQFDRLGLQDRIAIRLGDAVQVLDAMRDEFSPGSVDMVFLDADKQQYPAYWQAVRSLIAVGGLLVVDNAFGSGEHWIGDDHPSREAADAVCREIASDDEFEAAALPLRQGLVVARRMR